MAIRRMRIACWITKATNTLRICNTYFFSTATMVTRKSLNITFIRALPVLLRIRIVFTNESCVTLTNCYTDQHTEHRKWPSSIRLRSKCDGTHAETRFRLSGKRTSPLKSAETSVQSTTGSRGVRISGSNAGYTKFRDSVKSIGYPLHSPVSPSPRLPCVTVCLSHFNWTLPLTETKRLRGSFRNRRFYSDR
jgi:hypothetical protein